MEASYQVCFSYSQIVQSSIANPEILLKSLLAKKLLSLIVDFAKLGQLLYSRIIANS